MRILLFPHGGSGNHGCEAIVRSTLKILNNVNLLLFSSQVDEDLKYKLNDICSIEHDQVPIRRFSLQYAIAFFKNRFLNDKYAFDKLAFRPILKTSKKCKYALSIGGDNYCYGHPKFIYLINEELRRSGTKSILWGCSIEPSAISGDMLKDLKNYAHIFARESITYQAMKEKGITQVSLYPDPAFQLNRIDLPLPNDFVEKNTIGINVSPMIIGHENNQGITLKNYITLIQYLIDHTDMQIALIPHVVWNHNDDRVPLNKIYNLFKKTGRVVYINDHNAEELKGYIARCRFMIAARTHASIAAYSEHVPTLVVGYSVKARGIAKDIFGTDQNYVIPVQSLNTTNSLLNAFLWIYDHESMIRQHYKNFMPSYKASAIEAGLKLKQL